MILILIFIIIILLFFCTIKNSIFKDDTNEIQYKNEQFKVVGNTYDEKIKKAETLYNLKEKLKKIVNYCVENDFPTKNDAERFSQRFEKIKFNETASNDPSAAYVVNKSQELRICLKTKDLNDTMFVLLHECSHIMSETYGHNEEFKRNMDHLVKLAVKLELYIPTDYSKNPINYCGVNISNTPCSNNRCLIGSKF